MNIDIPADLLARLQAAADQRGGNLSDLLESMLDHFEAEALPPEMPNWYAQAEQFRQHLIQNYPAFPDAAELITELREERLDDIMGS